MTVTITGIDDINRILSEIAPREAGNLLQATTYDIAKQLADDAKTYTPDDPATSTWVGDFFKAKRNKRTKTMVSSDTVVMRDSAARTYIWRFLEYGTGPEGIEHAMFFKALATMAPNINRKYMDVFGNKLTKRLARLAKKSGTA